MIGLGAATTTDSVKHADINIFTVASGLLYEVSYPVRSSECSLPVAALRIYHDSKRDEEYSVIRQVLVHCMSYLSS